mmetsp:Transcript_14815/g.32282  ORF Transcript_14815/g.32282 Transcript_14815/m.32282 type:complete len:121 (-) Transcript_14815:145-507(-)
MMTSVPSIDIMDWAAQTSILFCPKLFNLNNVLTSSYCSSIQARAQLVHTIHPCMHINNFLLISSLFNIQFIMVYGKDPRMANPTITRPIKNISSNRWMSHVRGTTNLILLLRTENLVRTR